MTVRNVKKNLAAQQDLLPGVGPYQQVRRGVVVDVDGPAKSYIELWKEYCGEAYVGTFEDGFVTKPGCVAVSLALGKAYRYTAPAEVSIPANSPVDMSWVELSSSVSSRLEREALRRSYAEAGYTLVAGSFEQGGVLSNVTDVLLHEVSGKAYSGSGLFPQTVVAWTNPTSSGYKDRSGAAYRPISVASLGIRPSDTIDWSAAVQYAIDNISKVLYFPDGTYLIANLQLRSGCKLLAQSRNTILKLPANAMTHSINGSLPDNNGRYPGNVIATTLNHDGGVYYDGGVRARMQTNTFYIVDGAEVSGFTIDGNKAQNTIGDIGQNASAMGAGVNLSLARRVRIFNNKFINHRQDGVFVGYSLCGGSDDCDVMFNEFEGNQRCNIALITGQRNLFFGNTGGPTTGGPGTIAGSTFDLEPNIQGEVCANNTIMGNIMRGSVSIVCAASAVMHNNKFSGNHWEGSVSVNPTSDTMGSSFIGDTFISKDVTKPWLDKAGPFNPLDLNITGLQPVSFIGCTVTGFDTILNTLAQGQNENLVINKCNFYVRSIGQIVRGYKVHITDNDIHMTGGSAHPVSLEYTNTLGAAVLHQGGNTFSDNRINGVSQATFLVTARDGSYTNQAETVIMTGNTFNINGHTTFARTNGDWRFVDNKVYNFKSIDITDVIMPFTVSDNNMKASASTDMFVNQGAYINDSEICDNRLNNVNINLQRPSGVTVNGNRMTDGKIDIQYSFTGRLVGGNSFSFNHMKNRSKTLASINASTGSGFNAADFWSNDVYKGNIISGYTGGVSVSVELTPVSEVS